MSIIYLHLSSEMPAVFYINGQLVGSCYTMCQYVEVCVDEPQFVLNIYPIDQITPSTCSLPYTTLINATTTKPVANNDLITITDYGQNHYVICAKALLVPRIHDADMICDTCEEYSLIAINNNLSISNIDRNFNYTTKSPLISAKIQKINDFCVICGKNEQKSDFILLFNNKLQMLFDCIADKIELTKDKIVTLNYAHDIAEHGKVVEYNIADSRILPGKSYLVYTENTPRVPATPHAIPYAFLEAVLLQDYSLARSYLHPILSQSLKNENIRDFFGDFLEITPPIDKKLDCVSLVYKGNPRFVKNYRFLVTNNLIKDIDSIH